MSRFSFPRFWAIVLKEFIQMRRDRVTMVRTRSDEDTLAMDLRPPSN